ncbi:MAG TPA: aminoacyl-tRNA hydrolase [Tepidisphaeraceae bacterium]|jgi:PTH1 family peptidyl-tRNA hydrolase
MKLIVGLGNPGREYAATRHNVGFEVLDRLATKIGLISKEADFDRTARSNFDGLALDGPVMLSGGRQERVLLLKPTTYMNLSGRSVQAAKAFYQLTDADLMIVLDDIALPCGKIRLRPAGSTGGHNGLRDIERALGTSAYSRLRVGIDPPPPRVPQKDYVLGRFTEAQRASLAPAIDRAAEALLTWMDKGMDAAMNRFNADEEKKI